MLWASALVSIREIVRESTRAATTSPSHDAAWRALSTAVRVVDFQLGEAEAKAKFERWATRHVLSPFVSSKRYERIEAVLLPFWNFSANVDVKGVAVSSLRSRIAGTASTVYERTGRVHDFGDRDTQICASYAFRRDFVDALALCDDAEALARDATGDESSRVDGDACAMERDLAWHLALRRIRRTEKAHALAECGDDLKNKDDLEVTIEARDLQSRLIYLPVYVIDYSYGTTLNASQERVPDRFRALVGGTMASGVAGETLYSPLKAQVAVGTMCVAGVGADYVASPLLGLAPLDAGTALAATLLLCTFGGIAAKAAVNRSRRRNEIDTQSAYEKGSSDYAGARYSPRYGDAHEFPLHLHEFEEFEWMRWEESMKWSWEAEHRQRWAEDLYKKQLQRRVDFRDHLNTLRLQQAKAEEEARREYARERRYGKRRQDGFQGANYRTGVDFKGYYKVLGLTDKVTDATEQEIKDAFHKKAMMMVRSPLGPRSWCVGGGATWQSFLPLDESGAEHCPVRHMQPKLLRVRLRALIAL